MAAGDGWDAKKYLYLHDYLMKRNMHETATLFRKRGRYFQPFCREKRSLFSVIDSPQGFLQEWWSIFYDIFASRQPKLQEYSEAETSAKAEKLEDQSQNFGSIILPRSMINQQRTGHVPIPRDFRSSLRLLETNQLRLPNSVAASSSLLQQRINLVQHQVKRAPNYQQQFQILNCQPEISAQGLSHMPRNLTPTFPGSSAKFNYRNLILPKTEINEHDRPMMIQMMQTEEQQNQDNMLQQQQSRRKKKKLSNSRVADKKLVHHKTLDSIKAEEHKPVDDSVESFLSPDDDNVDDTSTPFRILRRSSNTSNKSEHKGFTFGEVSCLHSSKSKVLCCHFSSDGKLLASAGHEKKVLIWNIETLDFIRTSEGHSLLIIDVRFRPSSTIFATSSFDNTVQIWDAAKPSKSLFKLVGHAEQVLSLDFHPRKMDLLCSCDSNNEMRLWNINRCSCMHISKGATKQVRFQPRLGKLIATASVNVFNVIDVETNKPQFCLKGHNKEVLSICWDSSGKYIASISEDSARVWSVSGGECLHELRSTGNKFRSCTFHPGYSQLLVIGGYQSLELWNPVESNNTWTVEAHGINFFTGRFSTD